MRVGVRIRPLTHKEQSQGGKNAVQARSPCVSIGTRSFTYDKVFDTTISQEGLFSQVSPPLLKSFLEGYNATIMAYGQTGSGKTFTMGSEANSEGDAGLIPRFMEAMFDSLAQKKLESDTADSGPVLLDYSVQASFLEVYGEDIHDLLDQERKSLPLREDANGGVVATGLTNHSISSAQEALNVLNDGTLNRTTAATLMNLTSSRSHAIFTIYLSQTIRTEVDVTTTSKFTFVDLAGSERMKKTGAEGERAREGIKINEGLLALGNVINALADEDRLAKEQKIHVPYRQSKLTRLLQDALGGNSQTFFIACVSPADTNASETLSTLHYANRARNIKNAPTKNVDAVALELQRLHALNSVYMSELVQHKFGADKENLTNAMESAEVKEYLIGLKEIAEHNGNDKIELILSPQPRKLSESSPRVNFPALPMKTPLRGLNSSMCPQSAFKSICPPSAFKDDALDQTILEDINPEEELAILDQLLELQHKDQEFSAIDKKGQEILQEVQGELEEQEAMLLQLRESLKIYHSMKDRYQMLMSEVQTLEVEKASLADQLSKAASDPTKGCSLAIKKKLEKVENSLVRARNETRKHQQKYRQMEQEAKKCKALEQKITGLKKNKAAMIKKQKEASARHREYTESKTREILALKRKERNADKKASKLQSEIQVHKKNLAKRKQYTDKLSAKLKETESHLMKLLAIRQKELKARSTDTLKRRISRLSNIATSDQPKSQDFESITFLLNGIVADRVNKAQVRIEYEDKMTEYSEIMRKLVGEVRSLDESEEKSQENVSNTNTSENEENIEDLELRLELVSSDLERLRKRLSREDMKEASPLEKKTEKTIESLDNKTIHALLWEFVEKLSSVELEKQRQIQLVEKKDHVIGSLRSEVDQLDQKIHLLSTDLADRRRYSVGGEDTVSIIRDLRKECDDVKATLEESRRKGLESEKAREILQETSKDFADEMQAMKEKLALSEALVRQNNKHEETEASLGILQELWHKIGVSNEKRDEARLSITSCVENTCQRQIEGAKTLKQQTENEITALRDSAETMQAALGNKIALGNLDNEKKLAFRTLFDERDHWQKSINSIKPDFNNAFKRKENIAKDVRLLVDSMELSNDELSGDLKSILKFQEEAVKQPKQEEVSVPMTGKKKRAEMMKNVAGILQVIEEKKFVKDEELVETRKQYLSASNLGSLDSTYLERCEKDIAKLRIEKSRKLVSNTELRLKAHHLAKDMHLEVNDIVSLIKKSAPYPMPTWWDQGAAMEVLAAVVDVDGLVKASKSFSLYLQHVESVLTYVSQHRLSLSKALREVIELAQRALLSAVGEEVDASEACASFHEALFNLPPLSKEHISTCIEEIKALNEGVAAMTQSEIEALTVIWDALHIPITERDSFWGEINEYSKLLQSKDRTLFEAVQTDSDEVWIADASREASEVHRVLHAGLNKLGRVHKEVDRLRSKQDAKSNIISLDSEIRILSATLAEFEEKLCNKERLLTKKAGGSNLLKEGRFRKQMQVKFTSKLQQLATAVKSWKEDNESEFHDDILSEEVKMLLESRDDIDVLVKKRTAFMHLRTVQPKVGEKRSIAANNKKSSKKKKLRLGEKSPSSSDSSCSSNSHRSVPVKRSIRKKKLHSETKKVVNISSQQPRVNTSKAKVPPKHSARKRSEEAISKKLPFSQHGQIQETPHERGTSKRSKRDTLMPFGNILGDASPNTTTKENIS